MAFAAAAFLRDSTPMLFAVLFGLGVQATFFGPLKYGILPSHLRSEELVSGNGLIEAGTFLGILAGTIAGSAMIGLSGGAVIVSLAGLGVAGIGLLSAWFIPPAPPGDPTLPIGWNIARETVVLLRGARANRPVWLCLLALSWFWVIGATVLAELPTVVRDDLGASEHVFTLMLGFFSVGIGVGSMLCARLLRAEVSARLVPFAAVGLSVFLWDFGHAITRAGHLADLADVLAGFDGWRMLLDLLLLAMCGGLYSVPLYAIIQARSEPSHLARMIAANNVVNAIAIVAGALLTALLAMAHVAPVGVLQYAAFANLLVAAWTVRLRSATAV